MISTDEQRYMGVTQSDVDAINREHVLARSCAETAIKHAIRCGELLAAKKAELPHGSFQTWIQEHCEFEYSTAARYMKASRQISTGVEISKLSDVFRSAATSRRLSKPDTDPESDDDWLRRLAGEHPIPIMSGSVTLGITPSGDCAIVFYESRRHPGFWFDFDLAGGSHSTRPCRPELLSHLYGEQGALQGFTWSVYPDVGTDSFLRDITGCE